MPRLSKRHLILASLLALGLTRGWQYMLAVPPWQHPDEPTHFEHVRYIAQSGRWPTWDDVDVSLRWVIVKSMLQHNFWGNPALPAISVDTLSAPGISLIGISTAAHPRLYYGLAALWLRPWLGFPVETQLYALRLLSVALNLIALGLVYATAREVSPGRFLFSMSVCAFLIYQPMYTDMMSAVNNDALINTLGCGIFWVLARIYRRGWSLRRSSLLGGLLVGALLTKTTAVTLVVVVALSLLVYPWPGRAQKIVIMGVWTLGLSLVVGGLALVRLRQNDPGAVWLNLLGERYFRTNVAEMLATLLNSQTLNRQWSTAMVVFRSFWAAFGWRNVVLAPVWYWIPGLATVLALLGLIRAWRSEHQRHYPAWQVRYAWLALGAVLVAWATTVLRSAASLGANVYLSHGRYAFVAIAPFAILFSAGIMQWIPMARRRWGVGVYVAGLVAFEAWCFWGTLVPAYF